MAFHLPLSYPEYLAIAAVANLAVSGPAAAGGVGPFEFFTAQLLLGLGVAGPAAEAHVVALHALLTLPLAVVALLLLWSDTGLPHLGRLRVGRPVPRAVPASRHSGHACGSSAAGRPRIPPRRRDRGGRCNAGTLRRRHTGGSRDRYNPCMPHYTRHGDDGTTALYGGKRVPKHHPQPETYGAVDEAASALGLARALAVAPKTDTLVKEIQHRLYLLMGELAVAADDPVPPEFVTTAAHIERLEAMAEELEAEVPPPKAFVLPGETPAGGALDLARSIIRRAERQAIRLQDSGHALNPEVVRYLNRASSVLYDLARYEEHQAGRAPLRATRRGPVEG